MRKPHPLAGKKQSQEHIEKRMAAVAASRGKWTADRHADFRRTCSVAQKAKYADDEFRRSVSEKRRAPKQVAIYGLIDPRDGLLRYVGKTGCAITKRWMSHRTRARRGDGNYLYNWWRSVEADGFEPEAFEIETVPAGADWVEAEQFWIAYFRAIGCKLVNRSDGGEGTPGIVFTAEHRAKLSEVHKGQRPSAETIALRAPKLKAAWERNPESRWKPGQIERTLATKAERRAAGLYKKRVPATEETKAKISAAKKGRKLTPEHRAKLSAMRKGRKLTDAHKAALSAARRAVVARKASQAQ